MDNMLVLFRDNKGVRNGFLGRINWVKGSSKITWIENPESTRTTWTGSFAHCDSPTWTPEVTWVENLELTTGTIWTAVFGHCDADETTNQLGADTLEDWADDEKRVQQWIPIREFFVEDVFRALEGIYGFAKMEIEKKAS